MVKPPEEKPMMAPLREVQPVPELMRMPPLEQHPQQTEERKEY